VEPAEGSDGTDGRWRIARKVAEDRVISVQDPQTRQTRKSPEARRDGFRAHVVADPQTGIITGEQLTKACGQDNSDAAVAGQFLAEQAASGGPGCEWYGDSAYGTGDLRAAISQAGHTAVIKPGPLQPAVAGGFTTDDFTVDQAAGTVTCPAGVTRAITARRAVIFGTACRTCPLRARCTTAKGGRTLHLHPHDAILRAARATWATQPGLRENYRTYRPNVERAISQVASRGGRRIKLRYLGTSKNNAWLKNRTAALNLRNLIGRASTTTTAHGCWPNRPQPTTTRPPLPHSQPPARLASSGKSDHVAGPRPGLTPHRRSLSALFPPKLPFVQWAPRSTYTRCAARRVARSPTVAGRMWSLR
jgi:Transposase DDE domain